MRSPFVIGLLLSIVVIFAILVLTTRAACYVRRPRLGVADAEVSVGAEAHEAAIRGGGMGIAAVLLVALLYVGLAQWHWLGAPASNGTTNVVTPAPVQSPVSGLGAGPSPSPQPGGASPSPSH